MTLSRSQKIIVGVFTALPFLLLPYIVYEIVNFILHTVEVSKQGDPEPADILAAVMSFIGPLLLLSFTSFALLIFYIIHAVGNKMISTTERILWILIFIFIGIISFPVYWFLRLWNHVDNP